MISNETAEKGFVSCVLQGARDVPTVGPDWFVNTTYWTLLQEWQNADQPGLVALVARLQQQGLLEQIPAALCNELWFFAPAATELRYYHKALAKARLKRRQQTFAAEVLRSVASDTDPDQLAADMEVKVLALRDDLSAQAAGVPSLREAAMQTFDDLEKRVVAKRKGVWPGIPSGIAPLDDLTSGFQAGRVYVFGARPGMGKTSLLRQIMLRAAASAFPVYFLNLEMSAAQTFEALLATEGKVDCGAMQAGELTASDMARIQHTAERLLKMPIFVDDRFLTVPQIEATVRRMVREHKIKLFCLDYIQLVPASNSEEERNTLMRISAASNAMVRIAKQNNIPVIVLAQLNREAVVDSARNLTTRHIRDCGQIEQDAWFIGLMGPGDDAAREEKREQVDRLGNKVATSVPVEKQTNGSPDNRIGMNVVKNRTGKSSAFFEMTFNGPHLRFSVCEETNKNR
jgi:replicative DNA helicase